MANALSVLAQLRGIELCTSIWAITKMVNVLISSKKMERGEVASIENRLPNECRIEGLKIHFLDVSPRSDYDFDEFFYHVREGILAFHSGVGDIIHSVAMKNNTVSDILTFDEKDDFKKIPGLMVLHPRDVTLST